MTYEVSGVPHEDVYRILPLIDKHLNNVIPYTGGRYEKQDIVEGVENKLFDLWIPINKETSDINGVVITQFTVYPRKKVFTILLCCGDHLNKWYSPMFEMLSSFAQLNKCDLAEVVGRKGWVRKLKDDGFKQSVWIVEREFKNG
tara:strand:+ start:95 stop:526 length:432 start_codon:yes stop_codon:yes gene_type:complete